MKNLTDEELFRFLDGDCPADIRREYQYIIDRNPDVRAKLDGIKAMEHSAGNLGLDRASTNFTDMVIQKWRIQTFGRKVFDFKPLRFTLILIGLVVAAFIIGAETSFSTYSSTSVPGARLLEPAINAIVVVGSSELFKSTALIVMGLITLFLFDILVLRPIFSSRQKKLLI